MTYRPALPRKRRGAVLAWARSLGLPIINVRTEHRRDRTTWTLIMLEVVKTRDDAFIGTDLQRVVTELGLEALVLTGVSTHTCIAATAAHAFAVQIEVVLVRDAIGPHRPELHELALDSLRDEYRCPVLSAQDLGQIRTRQDIRPPPGPSLAPDGDLSRRYVTWPAVPSRVVTGAGRTTAGDP